MEQSNGKRQESTERNESLSRPILEQSRSRCHLSVKVWHFHVCLVKMFEESEEELGMQKGAQR